MSEVEFLGIKILRKRLMSKRFLGSVSGTNPNRREGKEAGLSRGRH